MGITIDSFPLATGCVMSLVSMTRNPNPTTEKPVVVQELRSQPIFTVAP